MQTQRARALVRKALGVVCFLKCISWESTAWRDVWMSGRLMQGGADTTGGHFWDLRRERGQTAAPIGATHFVTVS
jgi:hypothetical protein